jgi:hypothetical protein
MALPIRARILRRELESFRTTCSELGESLSLKPLGQVYWNTRWLTEVVGMRSRLVYSKDSYHLFRAVTIGIGIIVPALISLNLSGLGGQVVQWATLGLSVFSALCVAALELVRWGERWRINRTFQPLLFREGVQFATLSGRYRRYVDHDSAFQVFVNSVEAIIESYEVEYQQQLIAPTISTARDGRGDAKGAVVD